jgi:8-oxo-dGTP pyrophosphatase MutT (NUDIX family)
MTWTIMKLPISVKGIVFEDGKVWLRKNERHEWELPGGKLDPGEQPMQTVEREMWEELGMRVRPVVPVQAFRYVIPGSADESDGVLVVSYLCETLAATGKFETVGEAGTAEFCKFTVDELAELKMPAFYSEAIRSAVLADAR